MPCVAGWQAVREVRSVARVEEQVARVAEQERRAAAQYEHSVRKQAARTCQERRREVENQQRKLQAAETADHQRVMLRAQMLPWLLGACRRHC